MESVIAIVGMVIRSDAETAGLNFILSDFSEYIISRTGVPRKADGVNLISIMAEAPLDRINALSGKIGRLKGISAKTMILSKKGE